MADSNVEITEGAGLSIDTRTESTNGNHRQVIVIGDPAANAGVAPVDATNGLAVDVKASALPSGSATSAKQDTLLAELQLKADLTETQPVSLASVPSHAVTNAGTFATQATEADGANVTLGAKADAKSTATDTTAITVMQVLKQISASVQAPPAQAVTFTGSTDVATQTTLAAINTKLASGTVIGDVNLGATDNAVLDAIAASVAGATPAGDNNIGNVDIVSGTITTVTTLTGGGIAHDSADSGNPLKMGAKAYSPDGTTPGTAVAEADRTDLKADLDGRLFVNPRSPLQKHKHLDGTTAYTDESLVADPGDGFQVVITSIIFSSGEAVAINFFLEEGATKIFGPIYIEAVAGRGFVSGPIHLPVTASTAVTLTTSAANDQSFDMDYFIQAV